jgi:hypothetical protein
MDLSDPLVRDMADLNHRPEERWLTGAIGASRVDVYCETCGQPWPCDTRRELRAIEESEGQLR